MIINQLVKLIADNFGIESARLLSQSGTMGLDSATELAKTNMFQAKSIVLPVPVP